MNNFKPRPAFDIGTAVTFIDPNTGIRIVGEILEVEPIACSNAIGDWVEFQYHIQCGTEIKYIGEGRLDKFVGLEFVDVIRTLSLL